MRFLIVLYGIHLIFKFSQLDTPEWFSSYFADILCLPITLYFALELMRKRNFTRDFVVSKSMILVTWLYVSLIFEWILPLLSDRYTSDPIDALAYALGGVCFYIIQKNFINTSYSGASLKHLD